MQNNKITPSPRQLIIRLLARPLLSSIINNNLKKYQDRKSYFRNKYKTQQNEGQSNTAILQ